MASPLSTESLARSSAWRPWVVIGIWVMVLAVFIGLAGAFLEDALTTEFHLTNDADSVVGDRLVEERLSGPPKLSDIVIIRSDTLTVDDDAFRQKVESVFGTIVGFGDQVIESAVHNYMLPDESLVSADRHTTIIPFTFAIDAATAGENIADVRDAVVVVADERFEVLMTGQATILDDFFTISLEDTEKGESIAIPIALRILIAVFGAVVAALIPLIIAGLSIAIAIGIVALVGLTYEFNVFVTTMITMIGLAVGIDYSLFIVYRYRDERRGGLEKMDAIARAGATAGRAVFFSGLTVVLALSGMLLIPVDVFNGIAAGPIFVVSVSVLASLTLLPAVLGLLGDKINKLSIPIIGRAKERFDEQRIGGFWDTVSRGVMKQPVVSLLLAGGLLVAAAIPFLDINPGFADVESFPDELDSKKGFIIVSQEFPDLLTNQVRVVIDGAINDGGVQDALESLIAGMEADGSFGRAQLEVNDAQDLAVVSAAILGGDAASRAAIDAVLRLRDNYVPDIFGSLSATEVLVAGETAFNIDFFVVARDYAPIVFGFVLTMSFILLTVVFRSIVVALKSILLNLLSVGAAYGLLVLVFQKGVGNEFFGLQQSGTVEAFLPLFLFSILFGLSMDYQIFLLSRIRERFDQTHDNTGSVAFGVRSTGRLITGAALIMVAVFGGFASGKLVPIQQMGFGLGVAILLDATIVRMVLVPSAMKLLGDWNWYLPRWLSWLPDLRVEAEQPAATPPD